MIERDLDKALTRLHQKQLPECPANLERNVWRKTRIRKNQPQHPLVEWLYQHLFEFGWSKPVLVGSAFLSMTVSSTVISKADPSRAVSKALGFDNISQVQNLSPFARFGERH